MKIPYDVFRFTVEAQDRLSLPLYKGSTLRGGFGTIFKRIVCALKREDCNGCMLRAQCVYAYVFETSPMTDAAIMNMSSYERVPHPFIIEPPTDGKLLYEPGERLSFDLVLIGKATDFLPYFVYTFGELAKAGIGKGRGKYTLLSVSRGGETIYGSGDGVIQAAAPHSLSLPDEIAFEGDGPARSCELHLLTPVRIVYRRHLSTSLPFGILIRNLLRRIALLSYFHCGREAPHWNYREIIARAETIETAGDSLRWHDWVRYSARQDQKLKMGGLVGRIGYRGPLAPFMPILEAGTVLHVGKGTAFGLGKFSVEQNRPA